MRPLEGVSILDLSRVLACPFASMILAELGATVIKVEQPGTGDETRGFEPVVAGEGEDVSAYYMAFNRSKQSITVNLRSPQGQQVIRALAGTVDVVLENFPVGTLAKYGLDYASLSPLYPRLVYVSCTGFGMTGPYAHRKGYDTVFQAMSGMMSVTGLPDGVPGGGPMKTGPSLADFMAGQFATAGILAALYERDTFSGEGQHIDIALLDCTIAAQSHYTTTYLATGVLPQRRGTEGNGGLPSQMFMCSDRGVIVICGSEAQYRSFCQALRHPELADDPRFVTNRDRLQHRVELAETFNAITRQWRSADLLAALSAAGIPSGPVNTYPETFSDPQVLHRGMTLTAEHAQAGPTQFCASPIRFTGVAAREPMAPPIIGQHTDEVLRELLGLDGDAIATLRAASVV